MVLFISINFIIKINSEYIQVINKIFKNNEKSSSQKHGLTFSKQIRKGKNPTDVFRQFVREDGTELTLKELEKFTKNS